MSKELLQQAAKIALGALQESRKDIEARLEAEKQWQKAGHEQYDNRVADRKLQLAKHDAAMHALGRGIAECKAQQEQAIKPMTESRIVEIFTQWEETQGSSYADLIRLVEAEHGIKGGE